MTQNKLSYTIVPIKMEHILQLVEIEQECFSDPWTFQGFEYELSNPNALFAIAVSETGEVYGYMGMHIIIDEGYIANVAVKKEFRRKGIASTLMEYIISHANSVNLNMVTLEVRESNLTAIKFYEGYNFKILGVRKNYYSKPTENGLIMTKFIRENT